MAWMAADRGRSLCAGAIAEMVHGGMIARLARTIEA